MHSTTGCISVGFGALRSTIWRSVMWNFSEYVPVFIFKTQL